MPDGLAALSAMDQMAADVLRRYQRAELDFNRHRSRISACYRYALPWRHGVDQSQPVDQLDDIYDDILMTVVEDFAADMLNTFTPQKSAWVDLSAVVGLPTDIATTVNEQVKATQAIVFAEMARSNVYQALQESYLDLSIGTMALTAQDLDIADPIHCQAVPMTELRIDRGPYGFVDGRYRKRRLRCEDIRVMWPTCKPPAGEQWQSNETEHDVVDGVWRDWADRRTEVYHYVVLLDSKLCLKETYRGIGSCPMIVARWSRDSTTAYGVGPTYRSMPTYQSLNHVRFLLLKKLDEVTDPAFSYVHDGVMNLDQGVRSGDWIPRAQGSDPPEALESKGRFDVTWMQADDLTSAIKRAHYQDRPDQRGKTPPTATQWADEAAERQRRMGTPATNLVVELQQALFKRFVFLLLQRRRIKPLEITDPETGRPIEAHPLDPRFVSITPTSPLLRAQEQEELIRVIRNAEIPAQLYGPQIAAVTTDIFKTQAKVSRILGQSDLARDEKEAEEAIKQILPVLQASGSAGAPLNPADLVGGGPNG